MGELHKRRPRFEGKAFVQAVRPTGREVADLGRLADVLGAPVVAQLPVEPVAPE